MPKPNLPSKELTALETLPPELIDHLDLPKQARQNLSRVSPVLYQNTFRWQTKLLKLNNEFIKFIKDKSLNEIISFFEKFPRLEMVDFSGCTDLTNELLKKILPAFYDSDPRKIGQIRIKNFRFNHKQYDFLDQSYNSFLRQIDGLHIADRALWDKVKNYFSKKKYSLDLYLLVNRSPNLKRLSVVAGDQLQNLADLNQLTQLEEINFIDHQLSDAELASVASQFPNLKKLTIGNCDLLNSYAVLADLTSLTELDLSGCVRLGNNDFEAISDRCVNLKKFRIDGCNSLGLNVENINRVYGAIRNLAQRRVSFQIGPKSIMRFFGQAIRTNNIEVARLIVISNVDTINKMRDQNAVAYCVDNSMVDMALMLTENRVAFNGNHEYRGSVNRILQKAVGLRNVELVRRVLDNRARVNYVPSYTETKAVSGNGMSTSKTTYYETALHLAVFAGDLDIATLLLDRGAKPNLSCVDESPLISAIRRNHPNCAALLCARGADANKRDDQQSRPLDWAIRLNQHSIIGNLFYAGAKLDELNRHGFTPLGSAVNSGRRSITIKLVELGANVNQVDKSRMSPIHYAAKNGSMDLLKYLIRKGAVVYNIDSRQTQTPIDLAINNNHPEIAAILEEELSRRPNPRTYTPKAIRVSLPVAAQETNLPRN